MALLILGIGFCLGSFLNVLIYRLPRQLSVVWGRSFCPRCRKKISWYDNLPLLSFILLKGRCRFCRKPISWRYPLIELVTGILMLAVWDYFHLHFPSFSIQYSVFSILYWWILFLGLLVILMIDWENQIIPDEILAVLVFVSFLFEIIFDFRVLISNFLPTAFLTAIFFFFLHYLTKGKGMGLGDVKLAFLIGLVFGFPRAIICLYLAFLTGAVAGVILILLGKAKFGQKIPFGPFLVLAVGLTFFLEDSFLWLIGKIF